MTVLHSNLRPSFWCMLIVSAVGVEGLVSPPCSVGSRAYHRPSVVKESSSSSQLWEARGDKSLQSLQNNLESNESNADAFLEEYFQQTSACDDSNLPPSLSLLTESIQALATPGASDIRGRFLDHPTRGSPSMITRAIREADSNVALLTPLAAHCFGYAFATTLLAEEDEASDKRPIKILLGRDPRLHGIRLCDAFARGAESVPGVQVVYTGIATTPAMASFCRTNLCQGAVMVTASHLPMDKNGMKLFTNNGGVTGQQLQTLVNLAQQRASYWYDQGSIPPSSGTGAVYCTEWVNHMGQYKKSLQEALTNEVGSDKELSNLLQGIKIVLNSGNGSGGFFQEVLQELGADVSGSIHIDYNGNFPNGVPNPENKSMMDATIHACQEVQADLGILLDTDADRCGLVAPTRSSSLSRRDGDGVLIYQPIHRNRLIALMGVIFAQTAPGCAIVTCSVTSQGLSHFLTNTLGLKHTRYVKGYANVIRKAKEDPAAQVAIETSGHCAMKENDYLDDGTYTAVKTIGLLAREKAKDKFFSLLQLIEDMQEMDEIAEIRIPLPGANMDASRQMFDRIAMDVEAMCQPQTTTNNQWSLDKENLEGVRVVVGEDGSFFMLRKSLHDPVLSLQVEARSKPEAVRDIVLPMSAIIEAHHNEGNIRLDLSGLQGYINN